jgi:hypothetical protein
MEIEDIEAGKSYACYYKIVEMTDSEGKAVSPDSDSAEKLRAREGFGVIKTRDQEQRLVEILDTESEETVVVSWDQCWGVDEVEWRDGD